jgi:PXA domain
MSMTREFLFAGKLHKAVTFGLDIPSLLFSDGNGKECGIPSQTLKTEQTPDRLVDTLQNTEKTDDEVLQRRLFDTKLIRECEIDYNRVLGHRMVRALIPRSDYSSGIVRTLLTEMMGGCVLAPIMGIFCPEYLNSWIIRGLGPSDTQPDTSSNIEQASETTEQEDASVVNVLSGTGGQVENTIEVIVDSSEQRRVSPEVRVGYETPKKGIRDRNESLIPGEEVDTDPLSISEKANPDTNSASIIDIAVTASDSNSTPMDKQDSSQYGSFTSVDTIYKQLARALISLQSFVDFDECRNARMNNVEHSVQWENSSCKSAVICLVLVIEAALSHGRCTYKEHKLRSDFDSKSDAESDDDLDVTSVDGETIDIANGEEPISSTVSDNPVEVTIGEYESVSLSQILMELTSDIDAFEERAEMDSFPGQAEKAKKIQESMTAEMYIPTAQEQSTMRTLIAAWLHSGQIYRVISILIKAQSNILAPFYHSKALLRSSEEAYGFARQLIALVDVSILVDTMTILGCPRLSDANQDSLFYFNGRLSESSDTKGNNAPTLQTSSESERISDQARSPTSINNALLASTQFMSSSSTPRYLDFHRNESFACSLRAERERRLASWEQRMNHEIYGTEGYSEALPIICRGSRKGDDDHASVHKELHHIARIFYTGTNVIAIRDAARRQNSTTLGSNNMGLGPSEESAESIIAEGLQQVSLITIDTACPRRRLEVPDDDSSFLLRAQVRLTVFMSSGYLAVADVSIP